MTKLQWAFLGYMLCLLSTDGERLELLAGGGCFRAHGPGRPASVRGPLEAFILGLGPAKFPVSFGTCHFGSLRERAKA